MAQLGDQEITGQYAIYCADCIEGMASLPAKAVGFSIYSPPFGGIYNYSSSDRDLSNCRSYEEFLEHYAYQVDGKTRLTMPGRISAVHCMDVPKAGSDHGLMDLPGDIIRIHQAKGWRFHDRKYVWKEPLKVAIRTRALGLRHSQIVKDSTLCRSALADQILAFRAPGTNQEPVAHSSGLSDYAGDWEASKHVAAETSLATLQAKYQGWGDPKTNKLSHWIWQRYASAFWDDIRVGNVLPYKQARDPEDEKHIHPLQLDVIERCLTLWSNPGDVVLSPFMGVGSEIFAAVANGRRGVGFELKPTYYRQASQNIAAAAEGWRTRPGQMEIQAA